MDEKQVVKWLIVVAVVLIVVVEGATLFGLLGVFGGDGDGGATTDTSTPVDGVAEGEELLPETDRTERLTTATLSSGDRWTLTLTVSVTNTGETPYELRLGSVTTTGGKRVESDDAATTGVLAPNESGTVTAQWTLSSGSMPDSVAVTAVEGSGASAETVVERDVFIERLPVRG